MTIKNLFTTLVVVAAISMIVQSCSKKSTQTPDPDTPTLTVNPNTNPITFTAAATGESHAFTVTTNQASWDAVSDKTWCVVTKSETGFTVTAQANTSENAREEATITVTAGEATAVTIKANQQGADPSTPLLSVSPENYDLTFTASAADESHAYTVSTNQSSWDAVSDKTWCVVTKSETGFTVTAQENTSEDAREEATITVTAGTATPIEIKANQPGKTATIYVAGYWHPSDHVNHRAVMWEIKDGVATAKELIDPSISSPSEARCIVMHKGDTYIGGHIDYKAAMWKNGKKMESYLETKIDPKGEYPNKNVEVLLSDGGYLYAFGSKENPGPGLLYKTATVWKDGVIQTAEVPTNTNSYITAAAIHDGHIYMVGYKTDGGLTDSPLYWKDGVLQNDDFGLATRFTDIDITDEGDIYISGAFKSVEGYSFATIWKNGKKMVDGGVGTSVNCMAVYEGNVYFAGSYFWVDGTKTSLSPSMSMYDIQFQNGEMYATGNRWDQDKGKVIGYLRIGMEDTMIPLPGHEDGWYTFGNEIIVEE